MARINCYRLKVHPPYPLNKPNKILVTPQHVTQPICLPSKPLIQRQLRIRENHRVEEAWPALGEEPLLVP